MGAEHVPMPYRKPERGANGKIVGSHFVGECAVSEV
jgi:hypothetical protein